MTPLNKMPEWIIEHMHRCPNPDCKAKWTCINPYCYKPSRATCKQCREQE